MKILILKVQTIGDTLLTSPLISNLKKYYVDAVIDMIVNEGTRQVLEFNPDVNRLIEYKRESYRNLKKWQRLIKNLQFLKNIRRSKYDLVIDLDEGDRGAFVTWVSGAKIKLGSSTISNRVLRSVYTHYLPARGNRHIVEIYLDALRVLKVPIFNKEVKYFWSKDDEQFALKKLANVNDFIHIHPFSRGWFKDIDEHIVVKIIDYCEKELGIKTALTAASNPRELDKLDSILKSCNSNPLNLGGQLSLTQVGALNSQAKLFIGVDTAIMHISAANDTPTIAFFGPTASYTWGPWDNQSGYANYHRGGGLQINNKHRVLSEKRNCMPCNNDGCNNTLVSDCLKCLNISSIKKTIREMLT